MDNGFIDQGAAMNRKCIELEARHGAHNYHPLPMVLERGAGVYLWDTEGRRYLDMMSAYSAVSFGHSHPELVAALREQAGRLAVTSRAFYTDQLGPLLEMLCRLTGMDRALPMNSGAEGVETAIKAARKWGNRVRGIPDGRARIIVAAGNFAGRTTTIISFSSEAQYRDGFGPLTPGFDTVPYGDAAALEAAITPETVAFLVEPIQGEAGIIVPPEGYLRAAREICTRHGILLIADEVQTGLGRTGRLLACDHEGVRPDGLILGKALGGGLLPISMFLARAEVMEVFRPGDHGSTFGGNPLACAVARTALEILVRDRLAERTAELGPYLIDKLRALRHPAIRAVRGRGLLVALDLHPQWVSARTFCEALMRRGVLSKETHQTVVRLAPPLTVTRAQIDEALAAIEAVFAEIRSPQGVAEAREGTKPGAAGTGSARPVRSSALVD